MLGVREDGADERSGENITIRSQLSELSVLPGGQSDRTVSGSEVSVLCRQMGPGTAQGGKVLTISIIITVLFCAVIDMKENL